MDFINIILGFLLIVFGILILIYYQNHVKKYAGLTMNLISGGIGFIIIGLGLIVRELLKN
ncbi:putative membrane protein [Aquimarina sp. EL_43]|nr:putative membrane protein [Aquimarina sp. EL_35]MBG6148965.1 putative membrane protein [Aquimarina sp. EL_32]MBG6168661.1 putative membrane protein [Aquimarina sp. EL_43]